MEVAEGLTVSVCEKVGDCVTVKVVVGESVGVMIGVLVMDNDTVCVFEGVGVSVFVGVYDGVHVFVPEEDDVICNVRDMVALR